jgi:hypothetical protein
MVKELRAGCLYRYNNGSFDTYNVCIGKIPKLKDYYVFMYVGYVPRGVTLETYSLNEAVNHNGSVLLGSNKVDDLYNYTYLGKVIKEPTERAIKTWITQLKLSGIEVHDYMMDIHNANDLTVTQITHDEIILGDWNNRKKLPCVQRFRKGSIYVREDLAYIRTRIPYHNNDKLWRYLGKQEDYYIWGWKYINDLWWTEPVQFEKPLENMVVFRQNAKGYQVVRK